MSGQSTADLIAAAAASAASGKEVTSDNVGGSDSSSSITSKWTDESESVVRAEQSTTEDSFLVPGEDAPEDTSEQTEELASSEAPAAKLPNKEVITVTDAKGKRKVEIDWNNRDAIKKDLQLAYGARKWQAERDQAIQAGKAKDAQLAEKTRTVDTLEEVYQQNGIEGLADLLAGRKGAYKEQIAREVERREFLKHASPAEVKALEKQEESERTARELEQMRQENKKFREEMSQTKEQAEQAALESRAHPSFDKHRFDGKLGDPEAEAMFDEMLWTTTINRLLPYEEQGLNITAELFEKEFSTVSSMIRKRIGQQANKKAAKVVEQKKQEATENVQAKVKSGYKMGGVRQEAQGYLDAGDTKGLLKNWSRLSGAFRK